MKREIYDALRSRITLVDTTDGAYVYHFSADGLNPVDWWDDENYVFDIQHAMRTANMWNVCQRFYKHLRYQCDNIDDRLLGRLAEWE
jgi:hypothetical protein